MSETKSYEGYVYEGELIVGKEPFGFTREDIVRARKITSEHVRKLHTLDNRKWEGRWRQREHKEDVAYFERQRELLMEGTEDDILTRLRKIYNRVVELEKAGTSNRKIGQLINDEFPDDYHRFHDIRRNTGYEGYPRWINNLEGPWQVADNEKLVAELESKRLINRITRKFKR